MSLPRMGDLLRRLRLTLELVLGRRLLLFAVADVVLLLGGALEALLSPAPRESLYLQVVLLPAILLGIPALADLVSLERRAGCLELALAVPSVEGYFLRRAATVSGLIAAQGAAVVIVTWLVNGRELPLVPVLASVGIVGAFLGAVVLFWATRLQTSGAVWLASLGTVVAFSPWLFANPLPPRLVSRQGPFLAGPWETLAWAGDNLVLVVAGGLLFLYGRRRLRRPETLMQ